MKNKILSLFALFLVTSAFVSCSNGDDVDAIVQINKPTMTIDFPAAVTVTEGDQIPFTVNLSAPVGKAFSLFIVLDNQGSTAGALDSDVENSTTNVSYQKVITIPPFVTTYSDVINIYEDDLAEPNETLKLIVGDTRTSAVNFQPVISTVTILNKVSDELSLTFNIDKTFTGANGYTNTICNLKNAAGTGGYDVDYILYDDAFADTGNTTAQTGTCNEVMTINATDLIDGLYHVTAYLYDNAGLNVKATTFGVAQFNVPVKVDYIRPGGIDKGTFTQESANWFTSATINGAENQVVDVLLSTVGGKRKFTIQDTMGNEIATGKMSKKGKFVSKRSK